MARPSPVAHLVGVAEIADRCGVAVETVHSWRRRGAATPPAFPAPLAQLRMGLVWWWPDVERWARATGRA